MGRIKDEQIDMLLCFMNDIMEDKGYTPGIARFDFNVGSGKDFLAFKETSKLGDDIIQQLLLTARSRGYIKYPYSGGGEIYSLTAEGQGRAISFEMAKNYTEKPQQHNINIGTINGPAQIGNNNTQNIKNAFEYILTEIENSNASIEKKNEAKSLLRKALEHPITNTIIGASVGAIFKMMGGV